MADPLCICDFPVDCDGGGVVFCEGCGGDFCVCLACAGHGESECDGCAWCAGDEDDRCDVDPAELQAGPEPEPED